MGKDLVPHRVIDSYSHHPPSVIQAFSLKQEGATDKSGVLNKNWTHHSVAGLWDVHTFHEQLYTCRLSHKHNQHVSYNVMLMPLISSTMGM